MWKLKVPLYFTMVNLMSSQISLINNVTLHTNPFFFFWEKTLHTNFNKLPSKNSQITYFCKLYCNLLLFRKYVEIYHFLGIWVWRNRVFHDTWVYETWFPWKKFYEYIFSKNSSFWNLSFTANLSFTNSSFKKVVDPYIFQEQ